MKFLLLVLTVSAVESIETTPPSGEWTPLYAQSLAPSDDNTLQHIETTPPSGEWTPLHTVPSGDYTPQYIASTSQSFNYATESADQIEDEEFGNPNKQCKRFEFKFNNELIKAVRCTITKNWRNNSNAYTVTYFRETFTFDKLLAPMNGPAHCIKYRKRLATKVDCKEAFGRHLVKLENF